MTTAEERALAFRARICAVTHLRRVRLALAHDASVERAIATHKKALALLALALLAGHISKAEFITRATAILMSGITQTALVGGVTGHEAAQLADSILAQQQTRIAGMARAIDASELATDTTPGRGLSGPQGALFAAGLAGLLWAGYQSAQVQRESDDAGDQAEVAQFNWVCKDDKSSCEGCTANADGSPYTRAALPGYPGDGSTDCGGNCRCRVERA